MVARLWLWICLLAALPVSGHSQPCHEVFGYYAGWKWYDRGKLVNPATINYSNYTVIAYAFFKPLSDGTVVCPDPWAEKNLLSGLSADTRKHPTLISEAHRNGVKVVLSVGGWTYSDIFPQIASSDASRKRFAASCASLVEKYGIDGIDIDWEYPGYARHGGSEADTRNFTLLLTELRGTLDKLGAITGKKMLLSSAFGVSAARLDAIEWDQIEPLLDCINLMSYNYSGPWDEFTGHNAPLFSQGPENSSLNIDFTVHYLIREKRVAPGKINIGIAFFGRASSTDDAPALRSSTTGKPDMVNFGADNGAPEYYNIISKLEKYHYLWDDQSGVPYLAGRSGNNSFVTFDDPRSVSLKARYAVETGLKGVIIWEITGDYLPEGKTLRTPLATAIREALCEPVTEEKYYERPGAGAN